MTSLALVMATADERLEPVRLQPAYLDGRQRVNLVCCLERTAVVEYLTGARALVLFGRLQVDAESLRWQKRGAQGWGETYQVTARRLKDYAKRGAVASHKRVKA